jgi:Coenzyme PQQ synthesis protein D (PqqD)
VERSIGLDSVVVRNREPVTADVDGTAVMMSLLQGKYYGLDAVGTRIWELIEQPISARQLCDRLMEEFAVDAETCERDVLDFVRELAAEKLVEVRDGTAA